jgi:hypothetical protein
VTLPPSGILLVISCTLKGLYANNLRASSFERIIL